MILDGREVPVPPGASILDTAARHHHSGTMTRRMRRLDWLTHAALDPVAKISEYKV